MIAAPMGRADLSASSGVLIVVGPILGMPPCWDVVCMTPHRHTACDAAATAAAATRNSEEFGLVIRCVFTTPTAITAAAEDLAIE